MNSFLSMAYVQYWHLNFTVPYKQKEAEKMAKEEIINRYKKLYSGVVSDACDKLGVNGGMIDIKPIVRGKIVGPATTVQFVQKKEKRPQWHVWKAVDESEPGSVLVIDATKAVASCVGGLMSTGAKNRGMAGIIVNGTVRDVTEIEALQLPVYARGFSPIDAFGRIQSVSYNETIVCGDVRVEPGDLIFADEIGVVVVPKLLISEVLKYAEEKKRLEDDYAAKLKKSIPLMEVFGQELEGYK